MKRMMIATTVMLCLLLTFSAVGLALALDIEDIEIGIGIGAPPRVEFDRPPELVPIPGRYVYFVPDIEYDFFYYHSRWLGLIKDAGSDPKIMRAHGNTSAKFPLL